SRGTFFLSNDFETLLDELFIFARHFFFGRRGGLKLLVHGCIKCRGTLSRNEFHQPMNFIVGYEHALRTNETRSARRQIKHVALTEQTLGYVFMKNDAAVDL